MPLITSSSELKTLCRTLSSLPYIAVDTEFLRDKYYYPKLCLIQIGSPDGQYLIDPLFPNMDIAPLVELFTNPNIIKVFHSAKQDIETFYYITGKTITPLYDTQVAAMAVGYFSQTSYATLVSDFLNITLDKTNQFSEWDKRPLSKQQISYAIDDVRHLHVIYPLLNQKLIDQQRIHWIEEEITALTDPATYQIDPDTIWQKLSLRDRSPTFLGTVKTIAAWREKEAQSSNRPRTHILKDAVLIDIASIRPKSIERLCHIRGANHLNQTQEATLMAAIQDGIQNPLQATPATFYNKNLQPDEKHISDLFKIALHTVSQKHHVAERLIISSHDLLELALNPAATHPVMSGWRYEIFGKYIEGLRTGKLALRLSDGKIELMPI
jgi:ribonuclease D